MVCIRRTPFRQRTLNRIFPCFVFVKVATFQNLRRIFAFIDDGIHRTLETELHVLRQVEFDIYITIPCEVFAERQIHGFSRRTGQVAHLHMTERTVHIGVERP